MNTRCFLGATALALASMVLASCGSEPKGSVSSKELAEIRQSASAVKPGMRKDDVLARYKKANAVRLASTQLGGATIEEWKTEAYTDSKQGRDLAVEWLYFRNDKLVDLSDARLDFRANTALVDKWAHAPGQ
jgi:hypothetical protein